MKKILLICTIVAFPIRAMNDAKNQEAQAINNADAKENAAEAENEKKLKEQRDKFFSQISQPIIAKQQELHNETRREINSMKQNIASMAHLVQLEQEEAARLREYLIANTPTCCGLQCCSIQ